MASAAVILLAPLMILTTILIRAESEGAILFKQDRVGRGNRLFSIYKFWSMLAESSDHKGSKLTARGDTRISRVIRATSINELPQTLNVLKGEISLVGPRPTRSGRLPGTSSIGSRRALLASLLDQTWYHRPGAGAGFS